MHGCAVNNYTRTIIASKQFRIFDYDVANRVKL